MAWGERFGHQGAFPAPRAKVQQFDFQLGRKMLSREEPRSLTVRNTTASYKKQISGGLSWQGWMCQFNASPPWQHQLSQRWQSVEEDCPVASLLTERDNTLGSYFLMQSIFFFHVITSVWHCWVHPQIIQGSSLRHQKAKCYSLTQDCWQALYWQDIPYSSGELYCELTSMRFPVNPLWLCPRDAPPTLAHSLLVKRWLWATRRTGTEWVWTFLCLLNEGKRYNSIKYAYVTNHRE